MPLFIKKAKRLCKSGYFGKVAKVESTVFLDMTGFSVKVAKIAKVYINAKKPPVLERSKKNGRPMRLCRNIQFTHLRRSLSLYIMEAQRRALPYEESNDLFDRYRIAVVNPKP